MHQYDERYWEREIDGWVEYFSARVDGFGAALVPATEADVRRLEVRTGLILPPEFRAFLRRAGRTPPGALDPFMGDYAWGVDAVAAFYAEPTVPVPPGAVYVWTLDEDCEMFLDTASGRPSPVVVYEWGFDEDGAQVPGSHRPNVYHEGYSLLQFLYYEAFRWLRAGGLPYQFELQRRTASEVEALPPLAERVARLRELAGRLGFSPVPYMMGNVAYLDRQDASLMFYPNDESGDAVYLAADSERELGRVRELIADHLGMSVRR